MLIIALLQTSGSRTMASFIFDKDTLPYTISVTFD